MKTLIIFLTIPALLLLSGCQENSITEPITGNSIIQVDPINQNLYNNTVESGFINLDGMLNDPYPIGNSFYKISGQIKYDQFTVLPDPALNSSHNRVSVYLSTNAGFEYFCTVCSNPEEELSCGFIQEESIENLNIAGSFVMIEKSFLIEGRTDGMMLKCSFVVTTGSIKLNAMWLALPDSAPVATHN